MFQVYKLYGKGMAKIPMTFNSFKDVLKAGPLPSGTDQNLFFSCHHVQPTEDNSRPMDFGELLFWDIDGADKERASEYAEIIGSVLGVPYLAFTTIWSGGGVHVYLEVEQYYEYDLELFRENYEEALHAMSRDAEARDLAGKWDFLFDKARVFRLPNSYNAKYEPPVMCEVIREGARGSFSMQALLAPFQKNKTPSISTKGSAKTKDNNGYLPSVIKPASNVKRIFPKNDLGYITQACPFLVHCKDNPQEVSEPQWYAALGTIAFNEDQASQYAHELSQGHPSYSESETNKKLAQVQEAQTGPTTCEQVGHHWEGCKSCPHYQRITTPYQLTAPEVIPSEEHGFYLLTVKKNGAVEREPDILGLIKKRDQVCPTLLMADQDRYYAWNGKYYEQTYDVLIESWCNSIMTPAPTRTQTERFRKQLDLHIAKKATDMKATFAKKLNLSNGILNTETMRLTPHSPSEFSTYSIPVEYDPAATCDFFKSWLLERLSGDQELFDAILDFYAYALAGVPVTNKKMLILFGEGNDGKSTLVETMAHVFGDFNVAFTDKNMLASDFGTAQLHGKRLAIMEEMPAGADRQLWEKIKSLVGGNKTTFNQKYSVPFVDDFYARFVMTCNKLPAATDQTLGLHTRMLIIPFEKPIENGDPYMIDKLKSEASGILNELVRRLVTLEPNGYVIQSPVASTRALGEYKYEQSPFHQWLAECVEIHDSGTINPSKLYGSYQDFCAETGIKTAVVSRAMLIKQLKAEAKRNPDMKKVDVEFYTNRTLKQVTGLRLKAK